MDFIYSILAVGTGSKLGMNIIYMLKPLVKHLGLCNE